MQVDYYGTQLTFTVSLQKGRKIDSIASKRSGDRLRADSQGVDAKEHSGNDSREEHKRSYPRLAFGGG